MASSSAEGVAPAVLPGTLATFPIPPEKLIQLAKKIFLDDEGGIKNPDALADNFRFEFPIISLSRKDYLRAVSSFKLKTAFPNIDSHPYDWRVDKYEPNRVWWTTRSTGTHLGPLTFAGRVFKPTNKVVLGAPECQSYVFNEEGKVVLFTGGYIMDRLVGNTNKLGGMFGILSAIGVWVPEPGSMFLSLFLFMARVHNFIAGLLGSSKDD